MITLSNIKPKLIVLDLDGTALNSNNVIPRDLQDILIRLKNNNACRIILASGRSIASMTPIAHSLGLEAPVITLNGGVIINPISNEIYYEKNISTEIYSESLLTLKKLHIDFVIFTAFGVYAEKPSKITSILEKYTDNIIQWISDYSTIKDPVKILFIPESANSNTEVKKHTKHLPIDIIESGFSFTEIVPKGVNKGSALQLVSEMLEIDHDMIIAFGDNENDIEMLQLAGTGVAMGNAPDHVKIEADMVTDTNDNDGVYNVLEEVFGTVNEEVLS
ncbi:MAG: HAD family hydrolase [Spirochaetales bacterium]|nr:HAD family hydrolase [Spirochaetales bacterium]